MGSFLNPAPKIDYKTTRFSQWRGWVSPGAATTVTPLFFPEKLATFFSHHRLPAVSFAVSLLFIYS